MIRAFNKWKAMMLPAMLVALTPAAALASHQATQAPKGGDMAVTGSLGLAHAFNSNFDGWEPIFTGSFEYYTTPRVSWRGLFGVTSFDADIPSGESVDFKYLNFNVLYNWEGGWVHPFVTGGVGYYIKDAASSLPPKADDNEFGLNGGGGIDWFIHRRFALKFEGTFHGLTGAEPDTFFVGTAGAKWWF